MKSLVLLLALTNIAYANILQPDLGEKTCVALEYTASHMRSHSKQLLSNLAVIIEQHTVESENYRAVRVVGERDGKLYGNTAGCTYEKDGSVHCQIDCDGGAFNLYPSKDGSAVSNVRHDYYFPLFKEGSNQDNPLKGDVLDLNYSDEENRAYR